MSSTTVGTDDRRRPRQGSTLFEKTKHRNTAARSQVPQSVISGLQRRRRQRPTVFARSPRQACSLCLPLRTAALDGQKRFVEVATRPPATSLDNNAKAPWRSNDLAKYKSSKNLGWNVQYIKNMKRRQSIVYDDCVNFKSIPSNII